MILSHGFPVLYLPSPIVVASQRENERLDREQQELELMYQREKEREHPSGKVADESPDQESKKGSSEAASLSDVVSTPPPGAILATDSSSASPPLHGPLSDTASSELPPSSSRLARHASSRIGQHSLEGNVNFAVMPVDRESVQGSSSPVDVQAGIPDPAANQGLSRHSNTRVLFPLALLFLLLLEMPILHPFPLCFASYFVFSYICFFDQVMLFLHKRRARRRWRP